MIMGAMIGTQLAVTLDVWQSLPLPAVWGWFLSSNPISYIFSVLLGSGFVAMALLILTPPAEENVA
ncbi:hypothetical protein D3C85_1288770 [compost metagenome]